MANSNSNVMINRRAFLISAASAAFATPLQALSARVHAGLATSDSLGYGPLAPVKDASTGLPLLELPQGFRYLTFGWTADPMDDGTKTPSMHDGMAAFEGSEGKVILVRNHEVTVGPAFADGGYDPQAGGGTVTLVFDPHAEKVVSMRPSLTGTVRNCAGGRTPWGSWLTCEESVLGPGTGSPLSQPHGYIFEVPKDSASPAEPVKDMGRFVHEAVAVDPKTGIVYETQDQMQSGLYRFVPDTRGRLADGGRLQMLAIDGRRRFDTRLGQREGVTYGIHWVDIPEPDRAHVDAAAGDMRGVLQQGFDRGGAIFSRLEGACYADGKVYVTATNGGEAGMGQVWELNIARERLHLLFQSPGPQTLNMPDNLCLSPRGALAICEDGTITPCVRGLTRDGRIVTFARNACRLSGERNGIVGDFSGREFAGVTYSPDGRWLFFNAQSPGITFAVTGPWQDGGL